ncbi:UNVERIFIED_CONTAM: hypothetical protein PYX00_000470 [Menopon gallinae]|uniref:Uncharacterized protein n=1 Tax=Menopon gallinae TaxID=328185 RepID=A0AAW2I958_9NEOP
MNKVLAIVFAILSVLVLADGEPAKYTSKYDNFDIDQVLSNDRLLNYYVKCLLDRGPCTPEGAELKRNLSEALKTGCSRCTDAQKIKSQKALNYIRTNKKDIWRQIEAKYDPEHTYRSKTEKRARSGDRQ